MLLRRQGSQRCCRCSPPDAARACHQLELLDPGADCIEPGGKATNPSRGCNSANELSKDRSDVVWTRRRSASACRPRHPAASAALSHQSRGCLNVFGMALDYFILVLLLDIWPQNSYADFCFIKCGLNIVMRHGCR